MSFLPNYRCALCGEEYPPGSLLWRCPCGGHLDFPLGPGLVPAGVDQGEYSLWRYRQVLPVASDPLPVTLGEGLTPPLSWII